ncbi:uncharacterized protein F5147DRAFT_721112 [Suillus discolor]|uniref:Secreted protein n=1 Tax=Suillus discolor TaxID=1912936 RepID=A0A9P7JNR5_9AGAM|nr:uncharacterized protein F5147DRAFT_721112 [Suillus discolor]KAG2093330.1 hypothetical protein F5147DRAFT_721112 [Suillus discolor]
MFSLSLLLIRPGLIGMAYLHKPRSISIHHQYCYLWINVNFPPRSTIPHICILRCHRNRNCWCFLISPAFPEHTIAKSALTH